jgi:glycosyltransferase involved in cell wall biosynthesis
MNTSEIILVSAFYPPHLGGQEIAVRDLAEQLTLIGVEVQVVTSNLGAPMDVSVEDRVTVTRLKSGEFAHAAIIWGLPCWMLRHTRRETIVHLHVGQAFTPEIVWLISKVKRFKYIIHMHIDAVPSSALGFLLPLYERLVLKRVVRAAEAVVVLNDEHKQAIQQEFGRKDSIFVMSNGISDSYFGCVRQQNTSSILKLLYVGRLSPQKNLPALVQAVGKIERDVSLDIIGDGECRKELEKLIIRLSLHNVKLHGRLTREDIMKYYASHDALVLPSLYEAQPIVLLEAMASRIPVIATRVIGIESKATGAAILVKPTVEGLIDGILSFADMPPSEVALLVDKAFSLAQRHRWPKLMESYLSLYKRVSC